MGQDLQSSCGPFPKWPDWRPLANYLIVGPNCQPWRLISKLLSSECSASLTLYSWILFSGCILSPLLTRSSATAEIARDAWNGHSRSLKVIRCSANRRGIYYFLLALNSNLTSIFFVLEISRPVCKSIPTSLPDGTGKRRLGVGGRALVSGCPEHWTIQP